MTRCWRWRRRTYFPISDGKPHQAIQPYNSFQIPLIENLFTNGSDLNLAVQQWMNKKAREVFNLDSKSFIKFYLLKLSDYNHYLMINTHHLVADGWSIRIFMKELAEIYKSYVLMKNPSLPELPIQYADFAVWEQSHIRQEQIKTHIITGKAILIMYPLYLIYQLTFQDLASKDLNVIQYQLRFLRS